MPLPFEIRRAEILSAVHEGRRQARYHHSVTRYGPSLTGMGGTRLARWLGFGRCRRWGRIQAARRHQNGLARHAPATADERRERRAPARRGSDDTPSWGLAFPGGGVRNPRGETPPERPGAKTRQPRRMSAGSAEPQLGVDPMTRQAGAWRSRAAACGTHAAKRHLNGLARHAPATCDLQVGREVDCGACLTARSPAPGCRAA